MRCLTYKECEDWCSRRDFSTTLGGEPDLLSPPFHVVDFRPPTDSGKKVWFTGFLYSLIEEPPEVLIRLGSWGVWPSSQHMPLFTRLRQACGERRPLIEAPGHLVSREETDDAISVVALSLVFVWDCYILSGSGRDAVFVSHDEFGWFASRDEKTAELTQRQLDEVLR